MNVVRGKDCVITKASELGIKEVAQEKSEMTSKRIKEDSLTNSTVSSLNRPIGRESIKDKKDLQKEEEQSAVKRISAQNVVKIKEVLNSKK